jgi:hypothetical protein
MFDGSSTVVLYDKLALTAYLPCAWRSGVEIPSETLIERDIEANYRVLQACIAFDDQVPSDKIEESTPQNTELCRIDTKINLLLDMVGRLLAQTQARPVPTQVRFNSQGAAVKLPTSPVLPPKPDTAGVLELYLHDSVPDPLKLVAQVETVSADGVIEVRFAAQPEIIVDLFDKLVFRRHRRRIADTRKPKRD